MSTLGAEIVLQTLLVAVVLVSSRAFWGDRARLIRLALAGALAFLLAAPAVLGVRWLVSGTSRELGFNLEQALDFSLHPVVLAETILPRLLGDPHAFSDHDFWGRAYFPTDYPYLVTLYLGLPVLLVASQARARRRLWLLAAVGAVLALGRYGPLGLLPADLMLPVRGPQKLAFLLHFSLALLAGLGLEHSLGAGRGSLRRWLPLALPGAALVAAGGAAALAPGALRDLLGGVIPPSSNRGASSQ